MENHALENDESICMSDRRSLFIFDRDACIVAPHVMSSTCRFRFRSQSHACMTWNYTPFHLLISAILWFVMEVSSAKAYWISWESHKLLIGPALSHSCRRAYDGDRKRQACMLQDTQRRIISKSFPESECEVLSHIWISCIALLLFFVIIPWSYPLLCALRTRIPAACLWFYLRVAKGFFFINSPSHSNGLLDDAPVSSYRSPLLNKNTPRSLNRNHVKVERNVSRIMVGIWVEW